MKKLVILGSKHVAGKNDPQVLAAGLVKTNGADFETSVIFFEDLVFDISSDKTVITNYADGSDLAAADLVLAVNWYKNGKQTIYRDVAFAVALYLNKHGVAFWNSEMIKQRSTTKLSATLQLALEGYDIPKTIFSLDPKIMLEKATKAPMILKAVNASRGRNNYLLQTKEDLFKYLQNFVVPNWYIAQEFIPNDYDLRVVCFGGEPNVVIKRQRKDKTSHLNNASLGAEAVLLPIAELPKTVADACRNICKIMGRELAGIDVIVANDGSSRQVFIEINAIPQLTSGTYVTNKLSTLGNNISNYFLKD